MSKSLTNLIPLSHKITVYVPATINDANGSHPIDNTAYVDQTAALLSDTFGGATCTDCIGYWLSSERGLEKEATKMVFAYAESLDPIDAVIELCEALKSELNQSAIALEIDNQMYFI